MFYSFYEESERLAGTHVGEVWTFLGFGEGANASFLEVDVEFIVYTTIVGDTVFFFNSSEGQDICDTSRVVPHPSVAM